jgi:hypothetical protein
MIVYCALLLAVMLLGVWTFLRWPWRALPTGRFEAGRGMVIDQIQEPSRFWFCTILSGVVSGGIVYQTAKGILLTLVGI